DNCLIAGLSRRPDVRSGHARQRVGRTSGTVGRRAAGQIDCSAATIPRRPVVRRAVSHERCVHNRRRSGALPADRARRARARGVVAPSGLLAAGALPAAHRAPMDRREELTPRAKEDSMNVRPLRDRVLVKRVEEGEQRIGGIIIPDTAKEKPQQALVVAVGNGRVNDDGKVIPLDVKAGDYVLVGKYAGTETQLEGKRDVY